MTIVLPMLAAMPLVDTDTPSTTVFLDLLARHEEAENVEKRMTRYAVAARTVDRETGEVTMSPDLAAAAALADCLEALAAWRAYADEARAMIALLDAALTTIAAIPVGDFGAWNRAGGLWMRLRYSADSNVRPLPPARPWRDWKWGVSLRRHYLDGHLAHLIVCRQRYRLLAAPGRAAVLEELGIRDVEDTYGRIYPIVERSALDARAKHLGVWTGYEGVERQRR